MVRDLRPCAPLSSTTIESLRLSRCSFGTYRDWRMQTGSLLVPAFVQPEPCDTYPQPVRRQGAPHSETSNLLEIFSPYNVQRLEKSDILGCGGMSVDKPGGRMGQDVLIRAKPGEARRDDTLSYPAKARAQIPSPLASKLRCVSLRVLPDESDGDLPSSAGGGWLLFSYHRSCHRLTKGRTDPCLEVRADPGSPAHCVVTPLSVH